MLVSNLQLKLNVVNLCNASRRRMHNASCTRRIHGSNFVESTPCGSMTFSHSIGFTAGNCVASLCVYLVLINVNQSCKSLCSQYLSTCIQATLYRTLSLESRRLAVSWCLRCVLANGNSLAKEWFSLNSKVRNDFIVKPHLNEYNRIGSGGSNYLCIVTATLAESDTHTTKSKQLNPRLRNYRNSLD